VQIVQWDRSRLRNGLRGKRADRVEEGKCLDAVRKLTCLLSLRRALWSFGWQCRQSRDRVRTLSKWRAVVNRTVRAQRQPATTRIYSRRKLRSLAPGGWRRRGGAAGASCGRREPATNGPLAGDGCRESDWTCACVVAMSMSRGSEACGIRRTSVSVCSGAAVYRVRPGGVGLEAAGAQTTTTSGRTL
jgi:hypothetical protein